MKKVFLPILFVILLPLTYSCGGLRAGYMLNEKDAIAAIRQLLQLGASNNNLAGAFNKDAILASVFPESITRAMSVLNMLGMTSEIDRFTTTLGTAAERTATASVPVFVNSINNMNFTDAISIIKNGGTSATDYLRRNTSTQLQSAIRPSMQAAINEYNLNDQWNKIIKPAQSVFGSKFNPDLASIMSMMVADAMFRKIAEKEQQVRSDAAARTTPLLQKVFSRNWN
jgi:hypothetical protein